MDEKTEPTSVELAIEIGVPVAKAFDVFTREFGRIKPRDHNLMDVEIVDTVLEPHPGGRVYDLGADGRVCQWGRVLIVEPPHRLVFSWDISPRWEIEPDRSRASEVEVTFTSTDAGTTTVVLVHRHLDRHGHGWEGERDAVSGGDGWPRYLDTYQTVLGAGAGSAT